MTQHTQPRPHQKTILMIGIALVTIAILLLIGCGLWIANRNHLFSSVASADAILFIDVPGRIAIDGTLQIDGPAPVPVSVGKHKLTFFDTTTQSPLEVSVKQDEFQYVPNPAYFPSWYGDKKHGVAFIRGFPSNTKIEIPDCTPLDAKYPVTCKSNSTLTAELSAGTYAVSYKNPDLGNYQEKITVGQGARLQRTHSFITTVSEWNEWRQQHGDIIEQQYPAHYRSGAGGALLLPFRATGELLDGLFH